MKKQLKSILAFLLLLSISATSCFAQATGAPAPLGSSAAAIYNNTAANYTELFARAGIRSNTVGGSANAITLTSANVPITVLTDGVATKFIATATNTTAVTLAQDTTAATALHNAAGGALIAGDIQSGSKYVAVYSTSTSDWRLTYTGANPIGAATTDTLLNKSISGLSNTLTNISDSSLASQAANTIIGNATAGLAAPSPLAVPSCSTTGSALNYTTAVGFSCNTAINAALLNGATFASPGTIGGTVASPATFTNVTIADTRSSVSSAVSALTLTTASGVNQGISYTANGTGTLTGGYIQDFNKFLIASDNINAAAGFVTGFDVDHLFGGSAMQGGREVIAANGFLTAASSGSNTNHNYVGVTGNMIAQSADTGTNPASAGTSGGAIFGGAFDSVAQNGATALLNVTGAEFNVSMQTGSTAWAKSLGQFFGRNDDVVNGTVIDAMLWLYNQAGGGPKWKDGILFDGVNQAWPINSAGTILRTAGAGTATNGIDLSATTFSGSSFKSTGFSVGPTGVINGLKALLSNATGTSGAQGISVTVVQTAPNAGDTSDSAASLAYTLTASSATNELVVRALQFSATNNLTGGGAISNLRGIDVGMNDNVSTTTTNQQDIYVEQGAATGTVTTHTGVYVAAGFIGTTKYGFFDAGQYNEQLGSTTVTSIIMGGAAPTGTTGSCVASSFTGGSLAGKFSAAVCAGGTIILSALPAAPNGYACNAQDQTTNTDTLKQTANTTTSVTFTSTTVAADVIAYHCQAF